MTSKIKIIFYKRKNKRILYLVYLLYTTTIIIMDKYIRKWFNLVSFLHFEEANILLIKEELNKNFLIKKFFLQIRSQWFNNLKNWKVDIATTIRNWHWLHISTLSRGLEYQIKQIIVYYDKKHPRIAIAIRKETLIN